MADLKDIYCGIGKPRSGKKLGTFSQCLQKKQVGRFGEYGIDPVENNEDMRLLLRDYWEGKRNKTNARLQALKERIKGYTPEQMRALKDKRNEKARLRRAAKKEQMNLLATYDYKIGPLTKQAAKRQMRKEALLNAQIPQPVSYSISDLVNDANANNNNANVINSLLSEQLINNILGYVPNAQNSQPEIINIPGKTGFKCKICGQTFAKKPSELQYKKHLKSAKHIKALQKLQDLEFGKGLHMGGMLGYY